MFVLGTEDGEVRILGFGGVELGLGLGDGFIGGEAGIGESTVEGEGFAVGGDGGIEEALEFILGAEFVIVGGEVGFGGEADVFEVGDGGLGGEVLAETVLRTRLKRSGSQEASKGNALRTPT